MFERIPEGSDFDGCPGAGVGGGRVIRSADGSGGFPGGLARNQQQAIDDLGGAFELHDVIGGWRHKTKPAYGAAMLFAFHYPILVLHGLLEYEFDGLVGQIHFEFHLGLEIRIDLSHIRFG